MLSTLNVVLNIEVGKSDVVSVQTPVLSVVHEACAPGELLHDPVTVALARRLWASS
jgi:hypothetical protein